jgi:hypothetical protein
MRRAFHEIVKSRVREFLNPVADYLKIQILKPPAALILSIVNR